LSPGINFKYDFDVDDITRKPFSCVVGDMVGKHFML